MYLGRRAKSAQDLNRARGISRSQKSDRRCDRQWLKSSDFQWWSDLRSFFFWDIFASEKKLKFNSLSVYKYICLKTAKRPKQFASRRKGLLHQICRKCRKNGEVGKWGGLALQGRIERWSFLLPAPAAMLPHFTPTPSIYLIQFNLI